MLSQNGKYCEELWERTFYGKCIWLIMLERCGQWTVLSFVWRHSIELTSRITGATTLRPTLVGLLWHQYCPSNYCSPRNSSDLKAPLVASFSNLMFLTAGLKLTISYLSSATHRPDSREASTQSWTHEVICHYKERLNITFETIQHPWSRPCRRLRVLLPSPETTWLVLESTELDQVRLPYFLTSCLTRLMSSLKQNVMSRSCHECHEMLLLVTRCAHDAGVSPLTLLFVRAALAFTGRFSQTNISRGRIS